jgi:NAD(P)-dependent dehydrogenase (short-subunit alcohol dehydrogenase family)
MRALIHGKDEQLEQALAASGVEPVRSGEASAFITLAPAPELRPLATIRAAEWLRRFTDYVEEPFWAFQRWARDVLDRGAPGRWIAITTALGAQPFPGGGADGTAASALQTLVQVAAIEYGARGMRANAIVSGWRADRLAPNLDPVLAEQDTPTGRLTTSEQIAATVAWLLSDAAGNVNGGILRLDGGYTLSRGARSDPLRQ